MTKRPPAPAGNLICDARRIKHGGMNGVSWKARLSGVACALALFASSAPARTIEGVTFAETYRGSGVDLSLNCAALLRYMVFIKAYVVGLYLPANVGAADVLKDVPKRLEIEYFHAISGKDFGPAGEKVLAQNVDAATLERLQPQLKQIDQLYKDVKPGDRYSLTYIPGQGTELALNGSRQGVIEGADFAAAYFAIWLGKEPIDTGTRAALLTCQRD